MKAPSFFIVGAPKCGTTALYHALRKHPAIFLPHSDDPALYWKHKEPFHFCGDLGVADWLRAASEDEYLALFEEAREDQIAGEATALNLFSEEAPERIHRFTGGRAKIIIMLRPPVGWMRSWHHDLLRYGYEDEGDFRKALAAGPARDRGENLPRRAMFRGCLNYKRLAGFPGFVERYLARFGRENVFLGQMAEFNREPAAFLARVCRFLEVDDQLTLSADRENDSAVLPGTHLVDLMVERVIERLPGGGILRAAFPRDLYRALTSWMPPLSDKSIEPGLRAELEDEFAEVARRTAALGGNE